jgi:hypothetical protein
MEKYDLLNEHQKYRFCQFFQFFLLLFLFGKSKKEMALEKFHESLYLY